MLLCLVRKTASLLNSMCASLFFIGLGQMSILCDVRVKWEPNWEYNFIKIVLMYYSSEWKQKEFSLSMMNKVKLVWSLMNAIPCVCKSVNMEWPRGWSLDAFFKLQSDVTLTPSFPFLAHSFSQIFFPFSFFKSS